MINSRFILILFLSLTYLLPSGPLRAQDPSAIVEFESNTQGVLCPRMTQSERDAIVMPAHALLIYQIDMAPGFYYNTGTPISPQWQLLGTSSQPLNPLSFDQYYSYSCDTISIYQIDVDNISVELCGRIYDSGGSTGNYGNNENEEFTITSSLNDFSKPYIQIIIHFVDIQDNVDTLMVNNNIYTTSSTVPDTINISVGSAAQIKFISDGSNPGGPYDGFDISWSRFTPDTTFNQSSMTGFYFSPTKGTVAGGVPNPSWDSLGKLSTTFGFLNDVTNDFATVIGTLNESKGFLGVAMGAANRVLKDQGIAVGNGNEVLAEKGLALGDGNDVFAESGIAVGIRNDVDSIDGIAIGQLNTSAHKFTSTVGYQNTSSGFAAAAFGYRNDAIADNSLCFGIGNDALGSRSSALGYENIADGGNASAYGYQNEATNFASTAFGYDNVADSSQSTAVGYQNTASGTASTAMGWRNSVLASLSSTYGYDNYVTGNASHAYGTGLISAVYGSTIIGRYNESVAGSSTKWGALDPAFIVGIGQTSGLRANAITVLKNGNTGIGKNDPTFNLELANNSAAKPLSSAWMVSSDRRLKKDIIPFTDGLNVIDQINPVWFTYNGMAGMPTETGIGTIAQQLQQIAPYMVREWVYHATEGHDETYLAVDYGAMDFVLINAVKEQRAEILHLKEEADLQMTQIQQLEAQLGEVLAVHASNTLKLTTKLEKARINAANDLSELQTVLALTVKRVEQLEKMKYSR